ncbi:membrane protein FxsA [Halobacteriales archaeon QS_4_69_34]|nr:MAG: membrane protein FxsA [Halobacteriales archaeon QS_4_69_34]
MWLRIVGALLLIPLLDAVVLVVVASQVEGFGAVGIVALVVLTALVGLGLVRAEGRHTVRKLRRRVERGELPTEELLDGGLLIAAGAFLLTPGFVTDAAGFLLVAPPTRWPIRAAVERFVVAPSLDRKTGGIATGSAYLGGFPDPGDGREVDADGYEVDARGDRDPSRK